MSRRRLWLFSWNLPDEESTGTLPRVPRPVISMTNCSHADVWVWEGGNGRGQLWMYLFHSASLLLVPFVLSLLYKTQQKGVKQSLGPLTQERSWNFALGRWYWHTHTHTHQHRSDSLLFIRCPNQHKLTLADNLSSHLCPLAPRNHKLQLRFFFFCLSVWNHNLQLWFHTFSCREFVISANSSTNSPRNKLVYYPLLKETTFLRLWCPQKKTQL